MDAQSGANSYVIKPFTPESIIAKIKTGWRRQRSVNGRPAERRIDILEANGISMDDRTFERFRDLIYDRSGITLGPTKKALVTSRIGKRMRTLGIEEAGQYLRTVLEDPDGDELVQLLDAISTNVTSFFREQHYF